MQLTVEKIISASILSANFACLGQEVTDVLTAGADWVHFDVMDQHYVANLTVGPIVCQALRTHGVTAPIDVHLMVEKVDELILAFAAAGASLITFHPSASNDVNKSLQLIRGNGCSAGLAFNPTEDFNLATYNVNTLDLVLLMTVEPGRGGQPLIPAVLKKIAVARAMLDELDLPIRLAVDGGVTQQNIANLAALGADTFVAGSAIFNTVDQPQTIAKLRAEIANCQK